MSKIKSFFDGVIPCALILLFPFEIYLIEFNSFNLRPIDILTIILLPFFFLYIALFNKFKFSVNINIYSILIIFILGVLSCFVSIDFDFLILKYAAPYLGLMASSIIFVTMYSDKHLTYYLNCIIFISCVVAIQVNIQFFSYVLFGEKIIVPFCGILNCAEAIEAENFGAWGFLDGLMRPSGFFLATNRVGTYLIPGMLLAMSFAKNKFGLKFFSYFVIFCFLFESIFISLARNGIIPAIFGFVLLLSIYLYAKKLWFSIFLILVFVITILVVIGAKLQLSEALEHFNPLDIDGRSDISNFGHAIQHFSVATEMWIRNFGLGLGFQNYDIFVYESGLVDTFGAHSNLLTTYGETGPIGLLAYMLPIVIVFISGRRIFLFSRSIESDLLISLGVSFISLFLAGLFRTYYFNLMSVIIFTIYLNEYRRIILSANSRINISIR
jgi:hypothetical protein